MEHNEETITSSDEYLNMQCCEDVLGSHVLVHRKDNLNLCSQVI
jgi:hypothetical protein